MSRTFRRMDIPIHMLRKFENPLGLIRESGNIRCLGERVSGCRKHGIGARRNYTGSLDSDAWDRYHAKGIDKKFYRRRIHKRARRFERKQIDEQVNLEEESGYNLLSTDDAWNAYLLIGAEATGMSIRGYQRIESFGELSGANSGSIGYSVKMHYPNGFDPVLEPGNWNKLKKMLSRRWKVYGICSYMFFEIEWKCCDYLAAEEIAASFRCSDVNEYSNELDFPPYVDEHGKEHDVDIGRVKYFLETEFYLESEDLGDRFALKDTFYQGWYDE